MNTNELRIGNLVNISEEDKVITGIMKGGVYFGEHGFCANIIDFIQPIPLTEEWLLKFGFEHHKADKSDVYKLNKFIYAVYVNEGKFKGKRFFNVLNISFKDFERLKYVHQLQNLYFALTGEELKLKDK